MKVLLTVMMVAALGGAMVFVTREIETSCVNGSCTSSAVSADYVTTLEWAIRHQKRRIEQLNDENAALAAELAWVRPATAQPVATAP